jgi:hypothetical protein
MTFAGFRLAAILGLFVLCQAQAPNRPARTAVSVDSVRMQSARDSDLARSERVYREILEKTNAQLGLWTNPYVILIAALGVLFTVGAIVVGVLIFRQGKDYRDLIQRSITEYQSIINAFIEEKNKQIEIFKQGVSEHIDRLSQGLQKATGEQKKQIETEIAQLRRYQEALKPVESPKPVWSLSGPTQLAQSSLGFGGAVPSTSTLMKIGRLFMGTGEQPVHVCSKCKTTYPLPVRLGLLSQSATCPKCGTIDPLP